MNRFNKISITGNRVTPEDVAEAIDRAEYVKLGEKIVICHLTLKDGFEVIGQAGVVDASLFDMETGKGISLQKAMERVWQHMGSILQDRLLSTSAE